MESPIHSWLLTFFFPQLNGINVEGLWFKQNSTICHTTSITMNLLNETFYERIILRNLWIDLQDPVIKHFLIFSVGICEVASLRRYPRDDVWLSQPLQIITETFPQTTSLLLYTSSVNNSQQCPISLPPNQRPLIEKTTPNDQPNPDEKTSATSSHEMPPPKISPISFSTITKKIKFKRKIQLQKAS